MIAAFKNNYGYDDDVQRIHYTDATLGYTYAELARLLKEELDLGRPFLADIRAGAAHVIVCDGYDSDSNFSMNYGWDTAQFIRKFDNNGAPPLSIYLGIKPSMPDKIILQGISIDNEQLYPGSQGRIIATVKNITDKHILGEIRGVLSDTAGCKRNNITTFQEVSLDAGESQVFNLNYTVGGYLSFGARIISIEYRDTDVSVKRVKVESSELTMVEALKVESSTIIVSGSDEFNEVEANDKVTINLVVDVLTPANITLSVLFVDEYLNFKYKIGDIITPLSMPTTSIAVPLSFIEVETEKKYKMVVVEGSVDNDDYSFTKIIKNTENSYFINDVYVKNSGLTNGNDNLIIVKAPDLSQPKYTGCSYDFPYTLDIKDFSVGVARVLELIFTLSDEMNNILVSKVNDIIYTELGNHDVDFNIHLPKVQDDSRFFLSLSYLSVDVEGERYVVPGDNISNPMEIIVLYRNTYDGFYISRSLNSSSTSVRHGETFNVDLGLIYDIIDPEYEVVMFNLMINTQLSDGSVKTIGRLEDMTYIQTLNSTDFSVPCTIPDELPPGEYIIFAHIENMSSATGEAPQKVNKYTSDLIDEVLINVF